jgi:hypothetical protein
MKVKNPSPMRSLKRRWEVKSVAEPEDEEEEDYNPIEYIWLTRSMRT